MAKNFTFPIRSECCGNTQNMTTKQTISQIKTDLTYLRLVVDMIFDRLEATSLPTIAQSSADTDNIAVEEKGDQKEVNVHFADDKEEIHLMISSGGQPDSVFTVDKNADDDLATFMGRPIRIYTKLWEVNESPDYVDAINPWELFLNDPKVINKLETFKLLNGTLQLKILVNGSPFHYGRMFFGVRPTRYDNNTLAIDPVTTQIVTVYRDENNIGVKNFDAMKCFYSQRPHVYIDPSTNQPQTITWPFFAATNWIDLTYPETVNRMGRLEIWELNKLKHSNGGTDPVRITIMAWMTNVTFGGLTAAEPTIAQSSRRPNVTEKSNGVKKPKGNRAKQRYDTYKKNGGKSHKQPPVYNAPPGKDEYEHDGMVTKVASAIAAAADWATPFVSEIPILGPLAMGTSIAANAVSGIASMFGWSRPAVVTDTVFVRPQNIGNLPNTSGADPIIKLTLDPKQELTVDPRTVGLDGEDQMSFGYLARKEAIVDTFAWNSVGTQNEDLLYSIRVHPSLAPCFEIGENFVTVQTPLSFCTAPFQHWSGSLRYRFMIVASQMHRGKLMFVYEPTASETGLITDTNDRFAHIVDITEERDVTFEINWTQNVAYKLTRQGLVELTNDWAIEGPIGAMTNTVSNTHSNGRINVYCFNTLAGPTDSAGVEVNVYISAGDSFELKNPNAALSRQYTYARNDVTVGPPTLAQSGSAETTSQENHPEHDTTYVLNGDYHQICPERTLIYFGENIGSFRSLMKRYCWHRALATPENETGAIYGMQFDLRTMPNGPGPDYGSSRASQLTPISGPNDYNICALTYVRYAMQAFIGYRGGIRWKYNMYSEDLDLMAFKILRDPEYSTNEQVSANVVFSGTTSESAVSQNFFNEFQNQSNQAGLQLISPNVNPTLEIEIPFQSNYRYAETCEPPDGSLVDYQAGFDGGNHHVAYTQRHEAANNFSWIEGYTSIGEDFSLFFFIGAPPLLETDVPTVTPA